MYTFTFPFFLAILTALPLLAFTLDTTLSQSTFEITDLSIRMTNIARQRYLRYSLHLTYDTTKPRTFCTGTFGAKRRSIDDLMACDTEDDIQVRIRQRSYLPEQAGFSIHVVDSRNVDGRNGGANAGGVGDGVSAGASGAGSGSIDIAQGLPGWTIQRNASYLIDEYRPGSGSGSGAGIELRRAVLVVDGEPSVSAPRAQIKGKEWRREEMRKR